MLGNILKIVPYIGLGLISLLFGYLSFMGIVISVNKIYYMIRHPKNYLIYTKDDDSFGWIMDFCIALLQLVLAVTFCTFCVATIICLFNKFL